MSLGKQLHPSWEQSNYTTNWVYHSSECLCLEIKLMIMLAFSNLHEYTRSSFPKQGLWRNCEGFVRFPCETCWENFDLVCLYVFTSQHLSIIMCLYSRHNHSEQWKIHFVMYSAKCTLQDWSSLPFLLSADTNFSLVCCHVGAHLLH